MPEEDQAANERPGGDAGDEGLWEIGSRFRLVVVAALRSKQLLRGAAPRVEADAKRRRNTSIAVEEVRRGLVHFTTADEDQKDGGGGRTDYDERNGFGEDQTDLRRRVA
jgi:DNA-directed RNA polymerase omega subunit